MRCHSGAGPGARGGLGGRGLTGARLLLLACPALSGGPAAAAVDLDEASCPAGGPCDMPAVGLTDLGGQHYYWPHTRGRVGDHGTSPFTGPRNLSASLRWTWNHSAGRAGTVINGGPLIDGNRNVYLTSVDAIRKFSPDGQLLWAYTSSKGAEFHHNPSIDDGALFGTDGAGFVFSLYMATGLERWKMRATIASGGEISSVSAHDGIVLAAVGAGPVGVAGGCQKVVALNVTDGRQLWDFSPNAQLWNFIPMFTDFGTFVFQDQIGGVYHLRLNDSQVLWTSGLKGAWEETWTDGGTMLGPNGIVYSVNMNGTILGFGPDTPGSLRAYRLSDGELLWQRDFPHPPNSWAAVGPLQKGARPAVVLPVGAQTQIPRGIVAFLATSALGTLGLLLGCCWSGARATKSYLQRTEVFWCRLLIRTLVCALVPAVLGACIVLLRPMQVYNAQVRAFDAETGDVLWSWDLPPWRYSFVRGDMELLFARIWLGAQPVCIPNPFASPTLDAAGTIYTGYMNGMVYAINDANGDNKISDDEVDELDVKAAFSHPGAAMAPGMLAIASCDTLHVFRY